MSGKHSSIGHLFVALLVMTVVFFGVAFTHSSPTW